MSEGFLTNARTAELFFRICRRYKIDDYYERVALIRKITAKGKAKYLRDVGEYTKGKRVWKLK